MASRTASTALRLGARTAQRSAPRAAVLPAKEASMGLRHFTSAPRNVTGLPKKSALGTVGYSSQRRFISERPDGRGKIYEFEDVRPRQTTAQLCSTPDASQAPYAPSTLRAP